MKQRLKGAQKGHSLLKKKADALIMRFRQILAKIIEVFVCLGGDHKVGSVWEKALGLPWTGVEPCTHAMHMSKQKCKCAYM